MQDFKDAMRDKDVTKKNTVQMVRAAILQIEKDKKIDKIVVVSISDLFGEAIKRIHEETSIGKLFETN